jgi:hypothetical protein
MIIVPTAIAKQKCPLKGALNAGRTEPLNVLCFLQAGSHRSAHPCNSVSNHPISILGVFKDRLEKNDYLTTYPLKKEKTSLLSKRNLIFGQRCRERVFCMIIAVSLSKKEKHVKH